MAVVILEYGMVRAAEKKRRIYVGQLKGKTI